MPLSEYERKLKALVDFARQNSGTSGARAIRSIVNDLEGNGPLGELLHSLDRDRFDQVIKLFVEFRNAGRKLPYNSIHASARHELGL